MNSPKGVAIVRTLRRTNPCMLTDIRACIHRPIVVKLYSVSEPMPHNITLPLDSV